MTTKEDYRGREAKNERGSFCVVENNLQDLQFGKVTESLKKNLARLTPEAVRKTYPQVSNSPLESYLFADIETLGLAYRHPIFLITWAQITQEKQEQSLRVTSLLARDYGEEGAILFHFLHRLHGAKALFTYNGQAFDLKRISRRAQHHGLLVNGYKYKDLGEVLGESHVDLLRGSKGSLQALEKLAFGYLRKGDIPGSQIPAIYDDYVYRRGNEEKQRKKEAQLWEIVRHNVNDVVTVAAILARNCLQELPRKK